MTLYTVLRNQDSDSQLMAVCGAIESMSTDAAELKQYVDVEVEDRIKIILEMANSIVQLEEQIQKLEGIVADMVENPNEP